MTSTPQDESDSEAGRSGGSVQEGIFHLALVAAAGAVAGGLWIDPASGASELGRAQLEIARAGLFALALGLMGLWLIRAPLLRDLRVVADRWRSAPDAVPMTELVPESGGVGFTRLLWGLLVAWSLLVAWALATRAAWIPPLTQENGITETTTVVAYLLAGGLAIDIARRSFGRSGVPGGRRWIAIGLAAFCLLIAGEETDWGQTYLQYETPDSLKVANIQGDFSLHNLAPPEAVPGTRWANWALRFIGWGVGGLLPLLMAGSAVFRRLVYALDLPVPPVWSMVVLFLSACLPELEGLYTRNNIGSELREVSIGVAIAVWVWACWRQARQRTAQPAA